ncbi:MAG: MFS transporter [Thermoleophilia bacterium]
MSAAPTASTPKPRVSPTLAISFIAILASLQGSAPNIASTALVSASRSLDMVGGTLALAASIQTLAIAASVITTGLLADRLGRRRVLMAALLVGTAGSLIVAAAPATAFYMLGQAIIGIGLGAVYGASFAYVRVLADPKKLAAAVGLFSGVIMLGTLVFTFVGGSLSSVNWRAAYLVEPVFCVIGLLLVPIMLPKMGRAANPKSDWLGQILLAAGIIAFLYGVSELASSLTAPKTIVPLIAGVVLLAGFFLRESRNEQRFFPVSLFRQPVFIAAILAGLVYNFGTAVVFLQVTNLWQYINGLGTLEVSLWQIPLIAAGIISALVTGKLMTSKGIPNRVPLLVGGVMTAAGMVLLAIFHSSGTFWGFLPGLVVAGAGVVIAAVPFGNLILKEAPAEYYGPVTSSRTTIGQFLYSIGFAVSTVMIDKLTVGGTVNKLAAAGVPPQQVGTGLDAVTAYAAKSTTPTTSLGKQALADAVTSYGSAFATTMVIAAVICLAAGVIGFLILQRNHNHAEREPEPVKDPSTVTP